MRTAVTTLVLCVSSLLALGLVILYSAIMMEGAGAILMKQLTWCALGLGVCVLMASVDYRWLLQPRITSWTLYAGAVILLILALIPGVGVEHYGARRWLALGPIQFQPSEFGKLALIIILAWYGDRYVRQMGGFKRGVLGPLVLMGIMLVLIGKEDRGTAILLAGTCGVIWLVSGVRWRDFIPLALLGFAGLVGLIISDPVRMKRIFGWLQMDEQKLGAGMQGYHAKLALGSGGLFGLGLGNSRQKMDYIPFHETDFIFSIIGEELGFIAAILVVIAFTLLVISGVIIASRAREPFGLLLGTGITFMIGFQAFINIAVVTGVFPITGMPLPFISRGGSNLLVMLTCIGILLSIARHAPQTVARPVSRTSSRRRGFAIQSA